MPIGTNAPSQRTGGDLHPFYRSPISLPKFFLGVGEIAVVRALTRNDQTDEHIGYADVIMESGTYNWYPAHGAWADKEGHGNVTTSSLTFEEAKKNGYTNAETSYEYVLEQLNSNVVPKDYEVRRQYALYVWVYKIFRTQQRRINPNSDKPQSFYPEVHLGDYLNSYVTTNGRIPDPWNGRRFLQEVNGPAYWMRGGDFNEAFPKTLDKLTIEARGNLSSRPLLIIRNPGTKTQDRTRTASKNNPSDWIIMNSPDGVEELQVRADQETKERIKKTYDLLPSIGEVFEGTLQWPPESVRSEEVPAEGYHLDTHQTQVNTGAFAPPVAPPVVTPPPSVRSDGLQTFLSEGL